jgi:hypothetical protein
MPTIHLLPVLFLTSPVVAAEPKVHRGLAYADTRNECQMLDAYVATESRNLSFFIASHGFGICN